MLHRIIALALKETNENNEQFFGDDSIPDKFRRPVTALLQLNPYMKIKGVSRFKEVSRVKNF